MTDIAAGGFAHSDFAFKRDVTKTRHATEDFISSYGNNPKSKFLSGISIDSISRGSENNNIKYSMRSAEYTIATD